MAVDRAGLITLTAITLQSAQDLTGFQAESMGIFLQRTDITKCF